MAAAALQRAVELHQRGDLTAAARAYRAILKQLPDSPEALHLLGVIEGQNGHFEASFKLIERSLRLNPHQPHAHVNRAKALLSLNRPEQALESLEQALMCGPSLPADLHQPAMVHRGSALLQLQRPERALESFETARRLQPGSADSHSGRGRALLQLNRAREALESFEQAIRLNPGDAMAHLGRGIALQALGYSLDALAAFDRALELPALTADRAAAHRNRAAALFNLQRPREAAESLERVVALAPEEPYVGGDLVFARLQCCDWRKREATARTVVAAVAAGKRASTPFALLAISDSPQIQLACARTYAADRYPAVKTQQRQPSRAGKSRISVAYFSGDFRDHPTSHLAAALIERHERSAFRVTALSSGADDGSTMRTRMQGAFDRFLDIRELSDRDVAAVIRREQIDILVDLNGFTAGGRPGILALRPAPIQVSYLGYPGTLGVDYVDYILADAHVIPPAHRADYAERIGYLPDCYQPNDESRPVAERAWTRAEAGLPPEGFVFCSFNASYKITPAMFGLWMRLLRRTEGSVLWLYKTTADAVDNLRREALHRGVASERLVFAERLPQDEHLARHALADLFLDTLPVNAHTTASDALWAGLPMLTCSGNAFAGRVAGSLLHAVGLPELITSSLEEYETRALELARSPAGLRQLRTRLRRNRHTHPLFDTDRYRRHLEAAYSLMWERWQRGEPPSDFTIEPRAEADSLQQGPPAPEHSATGHAAARPASPAGR
jgi:protein O-GlcNAc transferase